MKKRVDRIDLIWIIIIITLTFAVRFSPIFLRDYSKSYDTMYANEQHIPYTNDPGDSYYYARRIQDFASGENALRPLTKTGFDSKMIRLNDKADDSWTRNMFPIIGAAFSKVLNLFGIKDPMTVGTIYVSFLVGLAAVLLYIFIKNRTNRYGGVIAAVFLSCASPILANTNWAHCDTDGILIVLPIALMVAFYKSLECETTKKKIIWSIVSCLMYVLIGLSWVSYNVYYIVFFGVAIATLVGSLLFKGVFPKKIRLVILAQLLFDSAFSYIVDGKGFFEGVISLFVTTSTGLGTSQGYPSESRFISELMDLPWFATGFEEVFNTAATANINMLGSVAALPVVLFTVIVLIIICFRKRKSVEEKFRSIGLQTTIFIPWLVAAVVMLFQGRRFLENIILPMAILLGFGAGYIMNYIRKKEIHIISAMTLYFLCLIAIMGTLLISSFIMALIAFVVILICAAIGSNRYKYVLIIILTIALTVTPIHGVYKANGSYSPGITRMYYDTADWIKNNTPKDSMVTSWWDYGYFYQCYADRATIGHGGVFDGQYFYWLGKALMTSDFKLSAGIFRMLGNGGLTAQNILTKNMNNPEKECEALSRILPVSRNEAADILTNEYQISAEDADNVIRLTHPEDEKLIYLVISQDMFAKLYAISYYGNWDFHKEKTNDYYVTSVTSRHVEKGSEMQVYTNGNGTNINSISYKVDKKGKLETHVYNNEKKEITFGRKIVIENEEIIEDVTYNEISDTLVVFKEGDYYSAVCCSSDFCNSVMFRLFYTDCTEQSAYEKAYSTEISKEIFGDHSMVQHKIFCPGLKSYLGALGVYKINKISEQEG